MHRNTPCALVRAGPCPPSVYGSIFLLSGSRLEVAQRPSVGDNKRSGIAYVAVGQVHVIDRRIRKTIMGAVVPNSDNGPGVIL